MTAMTAMTEAHALARKEMATQVGREFYGTYAKCFADQLKAVYASRRNPVTCGFHIVEPAAWLCFSRR
jgi:hypothetical protein